MNDLQQPAPEPSPPSLRDNPPRGSIATGIGIAWLIVVLGHALLFLSRWSTFALWPEMLAGVAAIMLYRKHRPRTGLGILLGMASVLAVALLLMAACFGLVLFGGVYTKT